MLMKAGSVRFGPYFVTTPRLRLTQRFSGLHGSEDDLDAFKRHLRTYINHADACKRLYVKFGQESDLAAVDALEERAKALRNVLASKGEAEVYAQSMLSDTPIRLMQPTFCILLTCDREQSYQR